MVTLTKTDDGNLRIALAPGVTREDFDPNASISDVLASYLENGWEWVAPEDIGALTSGDIITDDIERDDQGNVLRVGRVYWDESYQVRDSVEELLDRGYVIWRGVE